MYIRCLMRPGLAISLAFASVLPPAALAAQQVFPGPAPCDTTLQACIDGAAPGDVIALATDGPIAESLQIGKSLTLRASTGFAPRCYVLV